MWLNEVTSITEVPGDSCQNQEPSGLNAVSAHSAVEKAGKRQLLF